jgi:small conductance mechanosensitive channel
MNEFLKDLINNLESYYYTLVSITPKLLLALVVIVLIWMIASRVRMFADKRLKKRIHDPLLATFIANLVKAVLIIIGIFIMFRIIGLTSIAGSMLAGAGISAFIIGFALKDIGENFLAGILLAFKRPFTIGDIIESNGVKGKVMALNLRDTQIKSDGKDIYIPNALLIKSTLINFNSGGYLLQELIVGIEYGADYENALEIIREQLKNTSQVSNAGYQDSVVVTGITGATVNLGIRYWVKTDRLVTDGRMRSKILISILTALKKKGFVIK